MLASDSVACEIAEGIAKSWKEFVILAVPPLTIFIVIALTPFLLSKRLRQKCRESLSWERLSFLVAFCLIGLVPGILAGYSQQAIAGTFLTATIGIVSALLSFGFAKDSLEEWRPLIPGAMIATLLAALIGFSTGGVAKDQWIIFDQQVKQTQFMNEQVRGPIEKARRELNLQRLTKNNKGYITAAELMAINDAKPKPSSLAQKDDPDSCF